MERGLPAPGLCFYHLTLEPQHHWTDQEKRVQYFICTLGNLLDTLNNIHLAAIIEADKGRVKAEVACQLEQMDPDEEKLLEG